MIVLATENKGKIKELKEILKSLSIASKDISTLSDFPQLKLLEETGKTFEENALQKARHVANETRLIALADDSGLSVDALNGAPGVFSARYAGKDATDEENYRKLLSALEDTPEEKRGAHFTCLLALANPKKPKEEKTFRGTLHGRISKEVRGSHGFGYDPVFIPASNEVISKEDKGKTLAELGSEVKSQISHRAEALRAFVAFFKKNTL